MHPKSCGVGREEKNENKKETRKVKNISESTPSFDQKRLGQGSAGDGRDQNINERRL